MQFVGIYIWSKELDKKSRTRVKSLELTGWIFICILSFILAILFYYEIPIFSKYLTSVYLFENKALPHILDALTNALSVIGQFLLIACYWEQYIIWTIVNLLLIVMYSGKLLDKLFCSVVESIGLVSELTQWVRVKASLAGKYAGGASHI
jgi:nicotinamide mononucleotide transporter PnuC